MMLINTKSNDRYKDHLKEQLKLHLYLHYLSPQFPDFEHRPHNRREQGGGGPPGLNVLDFFFVNIITATSTTGSTLSAPTIPHKRARGGGNGILSTGSNDGQKQIS